MWEFTLQEDDDLLEQVKRGRVTEQDLASKLLEHVERIDNDLVRS